METLVIPDLRFLDRQFSYLKVFLGGTTALYHQLQRESITGTEVAAIEITRKLTEVNKKADKIHPHILQSINLLNDTIFSINSEFLTQNPDVSVIKADNKDVKFDLKTTKPLLDKEERSQLNTLVKQLQRMTQLHKEYVYGMEKEANTFYDLKERIQDREEVIRERFWELDTVNQEPEIQYTLLMDLKLNLYKQTFRMMGFEALNRHAQKVEKKVQLEYEMKQIQKKIISAIETPIKERLAKSMNELVWIHQSKCISQNRVQEVHDNMMEMANRISEVLSDIIASNSTQYLFKPSNEKTSRCDFMRNVRNMDGFLMSRSFDELYIDIPSCETKTYGLQTNDTEQRSKKSDSYNNSRTLKVDQQNSPVLAKQKGKIRPNLCKDNIIFGWTMTSVFSSKKKYGFYMLNDKQQYKKQDASDSNQKKPFE